MAGPGGGQKGVVDALTNTYTDIAKMQLLPDAPQHMQFLQGLQQGIMNYIRTQANATLQAPPGGAMAGMGGPGGGVGAMPPGMGGGTPGANPGGPGAPPGMRIAPGGGAGMSGLMGNAPPDDLRRLLAQGPAA